MSDTANDSFKIKLNKLNYLKDNNKNPFDITNFFVSDNNSSIINDFNNYENKEVSIAGRIMTIRIMGKTSFCDVKDFSDKIQIYVKRDEIGDENYLNFKKYYDIGDFIGIVGKVFKTHKGEISVRVSKIKLLNKSLRQLPEKFHGLNDQEIIYRQRYLDLIVNNKSKNNFIYRSKIIKEIRNFLDNKDFLEVETPILQNIVGGANAKPFLTHHNTFDMDMYLRVAPEINLKKLIIGGFDKIYEIGSVFRNEGISTKHNPEFTLLELYQAYANYNDMMNLTEEIIKYIANNIFKNKIFRNKDIEIDLSKKFERMSMIDAVKKFCNIDFDSIDFYEAKKIADERNIKYKDFSTKGHILNLFFEEYVEDKLIQPTFIIDYPIEISPLTKCKKNNKNFTERFELYILGHEIANAYSELNDACEQRERFLYQEKLRELGEQEVDRIDENFLLAMEYGMPPTGGLGIGVDRLVMFFTNSQSIRDILFFPTVKKNN
ncbi:MAG: lysine--tRNA ligase [Clostridiales bacterium]|jgi:lysyl-tRNA synthetase class 2|nr:lysine--tRNA ligase [Clostridiales bacterium]